MAILLIGDVAALLGVSTWRIIQAERNGEITRPTGKTSRGWRVYTDEDIVQLREWRARIAARKAARQGGQATTKAA